MPGQLVLGPHAGKQQRLAGPYGTAAENYLVSPDAENLPTAFGLNAHRLLAFEKDAMHGDVAANREVQAVAPLRQIGERGAHAHTVYVVQRTDADAVGVRGVLVRVLRESDTHAGIIESCGNRNPLFFLEPPDREGALIAVEVVAGVVPVVFHLAEIGQAAGEGPLIVAQRGPVVVVLRHAAEDDLAVDGAGAAGGLPSRNDHWLGLGRVGDASKVPTVGTVGRAPDVVAAFQVIRQVLELRVVWACFQQEHRLFGILGKARRDHATCRAATHYYVVIFHFVCLQIQQSMNVDHLTVGENCGLL